MAFPPTPVYPKSIDGDRTLYLVYNTTEARLCNDNVAWSEVIHITPAINNELWPDNGFGNIDGELFYYDAVEKNADGKIIQLKSCARALNGQTKFNPKGTWVRGYVVAEHHNQIADAILNIENFVGYNFDPRIETLDWRIRNLQELEVVFDDFNCPDINFTFNIIDEDVETGILTSYLIEITPPGSINNFRLDFGDGQFTTTSFEGQHVYALNAIIDPVLTVSNDQCQMIITPVERENPAEPQEIIQAVFDIPIPNIPDVPDFIFVPCDVPEPDITLPPIVFPCISLSGQIGPLPSVIIGPDITLVSHVVIEAPDTPIQILHSTVTIEGGFSLPSIIFVDVPPTIVIDPPIPPTIVVITQSSITLGVDFGVLPELRVDWGAPPSVEVAITMAKDVQSPTLMAQDTSIRNEFGDEFGDLFDASQHVKVQYETVGIPSEIRIIPPVLPKLIIDSSELQNIKIGIEEVTIPDIKIYGPEHPIPTDIHIHGPSKPIPDEIQVVNKNIPEQIELIAPGLPKKIELEVSREIPNKIILEIPDPIPHTITLDASGVPKSISVNGIPDIIEVKGFPDGIPILFPDEMPKIELIYKGSPLEMKITMDNLLSQQNGENRPCFMMVPCPR